MVRDSEDRNDEESDRTGISEVTWDTGSKSTGNTCKSMGKTAVPSERVLQLGCDPITASAQKMLDLEETAKAKATLNENIKRDVTENVTSLSEFDRTSFKADGSTMDFDALASYEQSVSSSRSKGGRPTGNTFLVKHGKHQDIVDAKNFCAVAFLNLKQSKEMVKRWLDMGYMIE
jgi:hypothetical protein